MATVIRLKRGGRKGAPYYRMVVADSRRRVKGPVIEEIGVYHPCARPEPRVEINREKALDWLSKGAQPSATVRDILSKQGVMAEAAGMAKPAAQTPEPAATISVSADASAAADVAAAETPAEE